MAIDRGPWNALVDDDGSNLVGSVWNKAAIKTVLLDPIDNSLVSHTVFTPTDLSGAGLTFQAGTKGLASAIQRVIFLWIQVVYPATSNSSPAKISGFPHIVRTPTGVAQGYGPTKAWWLLEGSTTLEAHDLTTFATLTNAQLSGANLIISATYLTD